MRTLPVEPVEGQLATVIAALAPGGEVVLTRDGTPVATIKAPPPPPREAPKLGTLAGTVLYMAPDFDDIPEGFEGYV